MKLIISFFTDVEIPKYVDEVTPEYKPKFDKLVRAHIIFCPTIFAYMIDKCMKILFFSQLAKREKKTS